MNLRLSLPNPDDHPRTSELARAQLANGVTTVTTLLHTNVRLEDRLGRSLVPLADGSRDREDLFREISMVAGETMPADELRQILDASLQRLADSDRCGRDICTTINPQRDRGTS